MERTPDHKSALNDAKPPSVFLLADIGPYPYYNFIADLWSTHFYDTQITSLIESESKYLSLEFQH